MSLDNDLLLELPELSELHRAGGHKEGAGHSGTASGETLFRFLGKSKPIYRTPRLCNHFTHLEVLEADARKCSPPSSPRPATTHHPTHLLHHRLHVHSSRHASTRSSAQHLHQTPHIRHTTRTRPCTPRSTHTL